MNNPFRSLASEPVLSEAEGAFPVFYQNDRPTKNALEKKWVVGRFLVLLGWLYLKHRDAFSKVETIKGRGRLYFAKSARALHDAGKSVNPKQIPNSPYWVITTSPTDLKQQTIRAAMFAFGYGMPEIMRAEAALARSDRQQILDSL